MDVPDGWRFVAIGFEGDRVLLGDASVWDSEWTRLGESLTVPHPQYPSQRHRFDQYSVTDSKGKVVVFAAGEYSNSVWGFFERT